MAFALILKAASFAADKHKQQWRKDLDGSPYINHPLAVAAFLTEVGGVSDVGVICAALLHDTIEDTQTTVDELVSLFGDTIARIVLEVSDDPAWPKAERKALQLAKTRTLSHEALLIKLADKLCNVRDIMQAAPAHWNDTQQAEYVHWAAQVVDVARPANAAMALAFDALYAQFKSKNIQGH